MKFWAVVLAVAILACCTVAASAVREYPTFDGPTGVVTLPTAEIAKVGTINLAASYQAAPNNWKVALVRANAAVGNNVEVWAGTAQWREQDSYNENVDNFGAKLRLMSQANNGIDVAIGGSFGRDKWHWGDEDITKAFLAVTKDFEVAGATCRLTGGAMYNRIKDGDWSDKFTKPYAALEVLNVRGCDIGIEYRQRDDDFDDEEAPMSAVLRYSVPDKPVWIEIGTTNASWLGTSWAGQRGFFGVGIAFGGQ